MIKVRCYVDGLNFYHGVARPYNCQWVDLQALLRALLRQRVPDAEVERVILFTAPVAGKIREVAIREEKRSDVNLACRMVADAYTVAGREFDVACLVSNDADMAAALEVKRQLRQRAMLITPRTTHEGSSPSNGLLRLTTEKNRILTIEEALVRRCRLPNRVGKWKCPDMPGWRA